MLSAIWELVGRPSCVSLIVSTIGHASTKYPSFTWPFAFASAQSSEHAKMRLLFDLYVHSRLLSSPHEQRYHSIEFPARTSP